MFGVFRLLLILLIFLNFIACRKIETPKGPPLPGVKPVSPRSYHMGFQPWPYGTTQESVDYTWQKLSSDADTVSLHIEEGVPWPEAYAGLPFSANFQAVIQDKVNRTPSTHKRFLSVNPLNVSRNGIALYRGDNILMPLPAPWNTYALDSIEVKTAYLNYVRRMVQSFNPHYLCIGIEVNILMRESPAQWDAFVALMAHTYTNIKAEYPGLPIFLSFFGVSFIQTVAGSTHQQYQDQLDALSDLLPYTDYFGISLYPYMGTYLAEWETLLNDIPGFFDKLFTISGKPVAVTESGYLAEAVVMDPGGGPVNFNGSPQRQNDFVQKLLDAADKYSAKLIIHFQIRDYDQMWDDLFASDPVLANQGLVWRDTGLYDGSGSARPALTTWKSRLLRPYSGSP
jgi:hypothetical protein